MSTTTQIVIVALVALGVLLAVVGVSLARRRRSAAGGREQAPPRRAAAAEPAAQPSEQPPQRPVQQPVQQAPQPAEAEAAPAAPAPELQPLPAESRERYRAAWEGVQSRFEASPALALSEADALLSTLLAERGVDVDAPQHASRAPVLEAFRSGHAIEQQNTTHDADVEQIRRGMLHFRQVFDSLIGEQPQEPYPAAEARERDHEKR